VAAATRKAALNATPTVLVCVWPFVSVVGTSEEFQQGELWGVA
jgi:hypothetical protein